MTFSLRNKMNKEHTIGIFVDKAPCMNLLADGKRGEQRESEEVVDSFEDRAIGSAQDTADVISESREPEEDDDDSCVI